MVIIYQMLLMHLAANKVSTKHCVPCWSTLLWLLCYVV